jgi:hypothetical protein
MKNEKIERVPRAPIAERRTVDYINTNKHFDVKPIPKDIEEQNRIVEELVQWSFLTDALNIEEFAIIKRYNPYRLWQLRHSNDYFADRLEFARHVLAIRIEEETRYSDKSHFELIKKMFPLYHREYLELLKSMRPKISEEIAARTGIITVEIEKSESSPLVPERKNEHTP